MMDRVFEDVAVARRIVEVLGFDAADVCRQFADAYEQLGRPGEAAWWSGTATLVQSMLTTAVGTC